MEDRNSSSSEDEVFFGPMTTKEEILYRRYGHRKTEQFFPGVRETRKSITKSEDYFADLSMMSSKSEDCAPILNRSVGNAMDCHLRLTTSSTSSTDSDSEFGPEAFKIWNQQLMASTVAPPKSQQSVEPSCTTKASTEPKGRQSHALRPLVQQEGAGQNPSLLVQALHLTPSKHPSEPTDNSPLTLESLDLSVDDRLPVESYFEVVGKENVNPRLEARAPKTFAPAIFSASSEQRQGTSGIPILHSRHDKCFTVYSSNKLQELKAKSMRDWQHVFSPIGQYIRENPVPHLIQNRASHIPVSKETPRRERATPKKRFFPLPSPMARPLPVAKYTFKGSIPIRKDSPAPKYRYFPIPTLPVVIKHSGPSHVIEGASYLHGEESLLSARQFSPQKDLGNC